MLTLYGSKWDKVKPNFAQFRLLYCKYAYLWTNQENTAHDCGFNLYSRCVRCFWANTLHSKDILIISSVVFAESSVTIFLSVFVYFVFEVEPQPPIMTQFLYKSNICLFLKMRNNFLNLQYFQTYAFLKMFCGLEKPFLIVWSYWFGFVTFPCATNTIFGVRDVFFAAYQYHRTICRSAVACFQGTRLC